MAYRHWQMPARHSKEPAALWSAVTHAWNSATTLVSRCATESHPRTYAPGSHTLSTISLLASSHGTHAAASSDQN